MSIQMSKYIGELANEISIFYDIKVEDLTNENLIIDTI